MEGQEAGGQGGGDGSIFGTIMSLLPVALTVGEKEIKDNSNIFVVSAKGKN